MTLYGPCTTNHYAEQKIRETIEDLAGNLDYIPYVIDGYDKGHQKKAGNIV